jgi:hypothetical protein
MNQGSLNNPQSSFKDIIVEEGQTPPEKLQSSFYVEEPSGIIPGSTMDDSSSSLAPLRKYSKIVKWSSLCLSLCTLFYLIPGAWPLVLTFAFPIVGFIGAHKYSECLNKFYLVYLSLILIVQVIVMGVLRNTAYIVLQTFVLIAEVVVLFFEVKLVMGVHNLSDSEYNQLKGVS